MLQNKMHFVTWFYFDCGFMFGFAFVSFFFTHLIDISLKTLVFKYFKMTFHMTVLLEPNKHSLSNTFCFTVLYCMNTHID